MNDERGLVVIGAGLPRTGTLSLKTALEILYPGSKCYHMERFMLEGTKQEFRHWLAALRAYQNGSKLPPEQWKDILREYKCGVDYPISFHYKVSLEDAERDRKKTNLAGVAWNLSRCQSCLDRQRQVEVAWLGSQHDLVDCRLGIGVSSQIIDQGGVRWQNEGPELKLECIQRPSTPIILQISSLYANAVPHGFDQSMGSSIRHDLDFKTSSGTFFDRWTSEVKANVSPDRLLVFQVREGWQPLCRFLEVDEPSVPFPNVNDTATIKRQGRYLVFGSWAAVAVIVILICGIVTLTLYFSLS